MALTDLIPWGRNRPFVMPRFGEDGDPFFALQRDMNRILDEFARGFGFASPARFSATPNWPHLEVNETDKDMKVVAELPGMERHDVEVSLHGGMLTLKGEKKSEGSGALYTERWHGQFQRTLPVGADVDPDQVSASFKNGVLTVTLPKRPEAQGQVKRIPIGAA